MSETTTALHWLAELSREQLFITADDVLSHDAGLSRRTVHQYLNRLAREGELTQVGRGLYRTDSPPTFQPPLPERVRTLAHRIRVQLPFSEFTIWSTAQAIELAHMLPTRHVAFVEADQEVAPAIYEVLLSANEPVLLDPPRDALDQLLALSKEPVVVRRRAETIGISDLGLRISDLAPILFKYAPRPVSGRSERARGRALESYLKGIGFSSEFETHSEIRNSTCYSWPTPNDGASVTTGKLCCTDCVPGPPYRSGQMRPETPAVTSGLSKPSSPEPVVSTNADQLDAGWLEAR